MLGRVENEVTRGHWAGQWGHAALTGGIREELRASLRRWFLDKQQPSLTAKAGAAPEVGPHSLLTALMIEFPCSAKTREAHTQVCSADYSRSRSRMISVSLLDGFPSCARGVYFPPALLVLLCRFFSPFLAVAPNSVLKCKLDTFVLFLFFLFFFSKPTPAICHTGHTC